MVLNVKLDVYCFRMEHLTLYNAVWGMHELTRGLKLKNKLKEKRVVLFISHFLLLPLLSFSFSYSLLKDVFLFVYTAQTNFDCSS